MYMEFDYPKNLFELESRFATNEACQEYLAKLRWPNGFVCPKCGDTEAAFLSLVDEKFFRPTLGDLREWKNSKSSGRGKNVSRSASSDAGKHN